MIEIIAERAPVWSDPWSIRLYAVDRETKMVAGVLSMCPYSPEESYAPTATLAMTQAQKLMDSLWDCGLRPSAGAGSAGAMDAVQVHLQDMRALVFHQFKMPCSPKGKV